MSNDHHDTIIKGNIMRTADLAVFGYFQSISNIFNNSIGFYILYFYSTANLMATTKAIRVTLAFHRIRDVAVGKTTPPSIIVP